VLANGHRNLREIFNQEVFAVRPLRLVSAFKIFVWILSCLEKSILLRWKHVSGRIRKKRRQFSGFCYLSLWALPIGSIRRWIHSRVRPCRNDEKLNRDILNLFWKQVGLAGFFYLLLSWMAWPAHEDFSVILESQYLSIKTEWGDLKRPV
jgi:hypothetical protein